MFIFSPGDFQHHAPALKPTVFLKTKCWFILWLMKRVEQVAKDGSVVIDYDDPVVREKVDAIFERLFPGEVTRDGKQIVISGNVGILTAARLVLLSE